MGKHRGRHPHSANIHECMTQLLSRDDLKSINRLGLWSFFASVDQVKHFAAQPRSERQAFFDRFEKSLEDKASPPPISDADYRLFDLSPGATPEQIQQRFRELALAFHPDRREGDTELMQEINLAYRRLLDRAGKPS